MSMESTANSTAIHPLCVSSCACEKSGATASTSRMIFQMYQNGTRAISALSAENTQDA